MAGGQVISTEDFLGSDNKASTNQPSIMDTDQFLSTSTVTTNPSDVTPKIKGLFGSSIGRDSKWMERARKLQEMAKEGGQILSEAVPEATTTSVPLNFLLNLQKAAIEHGGNAVSANLSPENAAILGGLGVVKTISPSVLPVIKDLVKGVGSQLEESSGIAHEGQIASGALNKAFNDSSLMFSEGKSAARPLYEAAKSEMSHGESIFSGMWKPESVVEKAQEILSNEGQLEPSEALMARKAVDILLKSKRFLKDELLPLRDQLDEIAKSSENIAKADPSFVRGAQAEALRKILPQNKLGGTSPFKIAVGKALGVLSAPVLSPALQGVAATISGLISRYGIAPLVDNPMLGSALIQLVNKSQNNK